MAFKMKYDRSAFPFKPSPNKQSGGYGGVPGQVAEGEKGIKAQQTVERVEQRREEQGGPKIKTLFGKPTEGQRVGDEYRMGIADLKIFGGAGKKALRQSGLALEGDFAKHIKKKRRKNRNKPKNFY